MFLVIKPKLVSKPGIIGPYLPLTPTLPFTDSLLLPVGLNPYTPQKAAGILTDPAESEHNPKAEDRVATCTPYPPDEPPAIFLVLNGFLQFPYTALELYIPNNPCGTFV